MNYGWTQSLFCAIIQKPMEKSYWLFVQGTSFMLTADPPTKWRQPTKWRHSSPALLKEQFKTAALQESGVDCMGASEIAYFPTI